MVCGLDHSGSQPFNRCTVLLHGLVVRVASYSVALSRRVLAGSVPKAPI